MSLVYASDVREAAALKVQAAFSQLIQERVLAIARVSSAVAAFGPMWHPQGGPQGSLLVRGQGGAGLGTSGKSQQNPHVLTTAPTDPPPPNPTPTELMPCPAKCHTLPDKLSPPADDPLCVL